MLHILLLLQNVFCFTSDSLPSEAMISIMMARPKNSKKHIMNSQPSWSNRILHHLMLHFLAYWQISNGTKINDRIDYFSLINIDSNVLWAALRFHVELLHIPSCLRRIPVMFEVVALVGELSALHPAAWFDASHYDGADCGLVTGARQAASWEPRE